MPELRYVTSDLSSKIDASRTMSPPVSAGVPANGAQTATASIPGALVSRPIQVKPAVKAYIESMTDKFLTPGRNSATIIAAAIKNKFGLSINPDTARLATFTYDIDHAKPPGGRMLNNQSLTNAALQNVRSMNTEDKLSAAKPTVATTLLAVLDKVSPLAWTLHHIDADYRLRDVHEYIFNVPDPDAQGAYEPSNRLALKPADFRSLVWETALSAPYKSYLDKFWPAHEESYTQLSKLGFSVAAQNQFKEGSLSNHELTMALQAAGLGNEKRLEDVTLEDLKAPYSKDPNLETGLLSIDGAPSTDLIYVTEKSPRLNARGKKIHHTLLYIPGNASPIHRFDSVGQMKTWLADQAADANKRAVLATHFSKNDQDNRVFSDGVNQALTGLGGWTESRRPNSWGFTSPNAWDPQRYITTEAVTGDPFHTMTQRQKTRSYADANHEIVTDGDVTKSRVINVAEAAATAALMLTPLAMVIPEVALGVDAVYLAAGVAETAVGVDDAIHGKSAASDRIVFGLLNAAPVLVHGVPGLGKSPTALEAAKSQATKPGLSSAPASIEFYKVLDSEEGVRETQVIELGPNHQARSGTKRSTMEGAESGATSKVPRLDTDARDLTKINDLLFTFVDTYNGQERLNIVAHGQLQETGAGEAVADMSYNNMRYNSDELLDMLWDNNVQTDQYANIRLLMCNSGTGGEASFAAQFQKEVNVPVKAYVGKVNVDLNINELVSLFDPEVRKLGVVQLEGVLPHARRHRVAKQNPYSADPAGEDYKHYLAYNYQPVHFPPRSENPKLRSVMPSMPAL
ncbi:hypothetical protein RGV33_17540 [Pseudomonas sp. Bout1]|uniref:dermonecrotic toxin domain-containing protein n=1 Tax=Pseudomonas sp. Bout1 TaxID=3048600 RepID=UPI002AB3852D|nr:DUF6543 domain-containing protein [Pseudomonas sp. Bout1]MDY7533467.1 hypothetical protein [Pseudomonas sp. Bout1]MEB0187879.1 hypothetical protein [Pseudomonas sp. Bout1]